MSSASFGRLLVAAVTSILVLSGWAAAQATNLESEFKDPPESAKPRVWWHWMNGNVTKEGITADMEWMKRVGIGGMQMFDANLSTPQFVDKRLVWMTPEWKDAFRHAASEADRLGLEMSMAASGGWSESGGPSVKPSQAMKKVVWSETEVDGPREFAGNLPQPPAVNGPFQNIPRSKPFQFPVDMTLPGAKPKVPEVETSVDPTFYADVKVIAYRVPADDHRVADLHPKLTSSAANVRTGAFIDGDFGKAVAIPFAPGDKQEWIQFEFAEPFHARSFTMATTGGAQFSGGLIPDGKVEASQDGMNWVTLLTLPGPGHPFSGFPVRTFSFPETLAKFFRITLDRPHPSRTAALLGLPAPSSIDIAELDFTSGPRVNRWEEKAQFGNMLEYGSDASAAPPTNDVILSKNVIDLTSKVGKDGTLNWEVPAGRWIILRLGYSLTGQKNGPASPEATGFEVDKLNRSDVESYFQNYEAQISSTLGPYFGKSFRYFLMDSWEAGMENWTENMLAEFQKRRGYNPTTYLPVLTGRVVESEDVSERFLWDFRRTIADLLAENHYSAASEFLSRHGTGLYAEAPGTGDPTTGDGLQDKGVVSIPMGEFWTSLPGQSDTPEHISDVQEAASAAHIYGKPIVATESFTSMPFIPGWGQSPFYLKPIGDKFLAMGVNRVVFHTSVHQPFVDEKHKPGMTLGPFGQHYTRNNTWAEQSVAWNSYLARSCYLLQQGRFVADAAYYYGEGAPVTVPFWKQVQPMLPPGYRYDWINTDVLLNRTSVKEGTVMLSSGMSYRVLVLPTDVDQLTLPVLQKIRELVMNGATVVAPKPRQSPSLTGYPSVDGEIRNIANELWGQTDGKSITEKVYGKGKVYWGRSLEDVLAADQTEPDFEYNRPHIDTELVWIHRRTDGSDIYFVGNQRGQVENIQASFRVDGKEAEFWHPDTGTIEPAEYKIEHGRTTVPLHLDPDGSVFVVFRGKASASSRTLLHPVSQELATVQGPWQLSFPRNWGAPAQVELDRLTSWTDSSDAGVKYFSGTATYTRTFDARREWFRPGTRIILDLGRVKEIAEVSINDKPVGRILWKPPFQTDVTEFLKPGQNRLVIKVTNLWPNRIIGDQQPSATNTYTFTDYRAYRADSPLFESGLLGPVKVLSLTSR